MKFATTTLPQLRERWTCVRSSSVKSGTTSPDQVGISGPPRPAARSLSNLGALRTERILFGVLVAHHADGFCGGDTFLPTTRRERHDAAETVLRAHFHSALGGIVIAAGVQRPGWKRWPLRAPA